MCLQFSLAWEISRYSATVKLYLHEVYFFGTGFCWSYHIAYSVIFIGRVPTGTRSHPSLSYVDGFYYAGRNHPLTRVSSNNLSHTIFAGMTVDAIQSKLVWNMSKSFKGSCCCCCGISLCLGFVPSLAYTRAKEVFFKRPLITGTIWWTVVVTKKQTNKEYHVKCSSSISSCNQNRWFKGSF